MVLSHTKIEKEKEKEVRKKGRKESTSFMIIAKNAT